MITPTRPSPRREFLRFLAGSPLLAAGAQAWLSGRVLAADAVVADAAIEVGTNLIQTAAEALNVFDLEAKARDLVPPAHWGYLAGGVEDDLTLRRNQAAFEQYHLRPRRLIDVSQVDTSVKLFGETWKTPIFLCPAGSQMAYHEDGELATARAARSRDHLMILSNVSTTSVEDVAEARQAPVWFQLYPFGGWSNLKKRIHRAEAAGCPVLVVTVDQLTSRNRDTTKRFRRVDARDCSACHDGGDYAFSFSRKPMYSDDEPWPTGQADPRQTLTWDYVDRLRAETSMRIVLKGIVTPEDARLCLKHGVDGIVVSNHGGRAQESGWATLEALPEVLSAVKRRIPVMIDSGFRRGRDIFKALALGASAVGIGRPYLWGLAAFGQEGVERTLQLLTAELQLAMKTTGSLRIADIRPESIGRSQL